MDKERPRKLFLCTPEKRRFRGNVTTIDNYIVKEQREGEGVFLTEHGNRMRGKTQRLKPGQFWLNKREKKNIVNVVKHQNTLPREVVGSISSEMLKTQQDTALRNLISLDRF